MSGKRTFAARTFASRSFGTRTIAGGLPAPGAEGWITRTAVRQFVSPVASRLSMTSPQDRVWIARVDNG